MSKRKNKNRIFDTMANASKQMRISIESLKAAKAQGCPAFKNSRVYESEFLAWIEKNEINPTELVQLKDQKLAEEIRRLKLRNDRDANKLVERSAVAASIQRILGPADEIMESKLVNEWPSAVAGMDPAQARVYGKRLKDEVFAKFRELEKEWKI